jgi:hypothetical protein
MSTHLKPVPTAVLAAALALLPLVLNAQTVELPENSIQTSSYVVVLAAENALAQTASTPSGYDTLQEFSISPSDETPSNLGLPSQLNLFCSELGQDSPTSPTLYSIVPIAEADMGNASNSVDAYAGVQSSGIGSATAGALEKLYGFVFPTYTSSSPLNMNLSADGISGDAAYDGAVFQMAVWQVTETGGFGSINTSGPGFYVSSAPSGLVSDADTLLSLVASSSNVTLLNLDALHSPTGQDYILPDPTGSFTAVPEPSLYAAVLGVAALAAAARRRVSAA